jgi:hypothetical protein
MIEQVESILTGYKSIHPPNKPRKIMNIVDKAIATQISNIEKKTGKSLAELTSLIKSAGLVKHGEIVSMLKTSLGLGHGDANTLTHIALKTDGVSAAAEKGLAGDAVLDEIYVGPKAWMRPIHEKLIAEIGKLGEYEVAPKKGYVSLRRKKQFAMLGPASNTRFEVGINMKGVPGTERLLEQAPGGMCQYKVKVGNPAEVDAELMRWIRTGYDAAG